jgi:hypothetical protein
VTKIKWARAERRRSRLSTGVEQTGSARSELQEMDWRGAMADRSAQGAWRTLRETITNLVKRHVPLRRRRNQNRPPWITCEILRATRRKKRLWKKMRNGNMTEEYTEVEREVKNMIGREQEVQEELSEGNGQNKHSFFAYVK